MGSKDLQFYIFIANVDVNFIACTLRQLQMQPDTQRGKLYDFVHRFHCTYIYFLFYVYLIIHWNALPR